MSITKRKGLKIGGTHILGKTFTKD